MEINVQDESSIKSTIDDLIVLEDLLLPNDLRYSLTKLRGGLQEWKGLSILTQSLLQSQTCVVDRTRGEIVAEYDSEIVIVLRFVEMLRKRLEWLGHDGNLEDWLKRKTITGEAHLHIYARHKSDPRWQEPACVVATGSVGLPITDVSTSFVLWANSGFPQMPDQLDSVISQIKSFRSFEEHEEYKENNRQHIRENARIARIEELEARCKEEALRRRVEDAVSAISSKGWRNLISQHAELVGRSTHLQLGPVEASVMDRLEELLYPEAGANSE